MPRASTGPRCSPRAKLGDRDRLIVGQPDAFTRLAATYGATPLDTLKAWMAFRVADAAAPYLPKPFADARFAFRGKTLLGQARNAARGGSAGCSRSPAAIAAPIPAAASAPSTGASASSMPSAISRPRPSSRSRRWSATSRPPTASGIEHLDWMGPATRAEALKKLDTYTIKVGYPDKPRDYSNLVIRRDDLVGNVRRAAAADWQFYVDRSKGPVDKADWLHDARRPTTPTTARCATSSFPPASSRRRSSMPTPTRPTITARSAASSATS